MKKLLLLVLALALALGACTAAPTQPPAPLLPEASPTPVVVVQTVVVEASPAPTDVVPPTAVPPVVVTVVVQPSQAPAAQPPVAYPDTSGAPIVIDNILGKGVFSNITLTGNEFTLRCLPREMTITATAALVDIKEAELFYRIVDQPKALYPSEWRSAGKMESEGNGVFSMVVTGENVHPDLRLDLAWFEFQLIGLNSGGGVVDRTQKIEQLVTYRIDCP